MRSCLFGLTLCLTCMGSSQAQTATDVYSRVARNVGIVLVTNDDTSKLIGSASAVAVGMQTMVTNHHVIDQPPHSRFFVLINGAKLDATPGNCDSAQDLCLLNVPGLTGDPVEFGSVAALKVGHDVYAVGAPNGILNSLAVSMFTKQQTMAPPQLTLTQGTVSALIPSGDSAVIQTNAQINPGSSGGGLFDAKGRLVGITTFGMRNTQGIGMALPVDWVKRMGVNGWQPPPGSDAPAAPAAATVQQAAPSAPAALSTEEAPAPDSRQVPSSKTPSHWWWLVPAAILLFLVWRWLSGSGGKEETPAAARPGIEQHYYDQAKAEFDSAQRNEVLWRQSLREQDGNENAARAGYIRRRAQMLAREDKDRQWAAARQAGQSPG